MALQASCTLSDWMTIIRKTVENAKSGDAAARAWLGRYLLGMPLAMPTTSLQIAIEEAADFDPVAVGAESLAAQEIRQSKVNRIFLSDSLGR
jgi:hypothetical protein